MEDTTFCRVTGPLAIEDVEAVGLILLMGDENRLEDVEPPNEREGVVRDGVVRDGVENDGNVDVGAVDPKGLVGVVVLPPVEKRLGVAVDVVAGVDPKRDGVAPKGVVVVPPKEGVDRDGVAPNPKEGVVVVEIEGVVERDGVEAPKPPNEGVVVVVPKKLRLIPI